MKNLFLALATLAFSSFAFADSPSCSLPELDQVNMARAMKNIEAKAKRMLKLNHIGIRSIKTELAGTKPEGLVKGLYRVEGERYYVRVTVVTNSGNTLDMHNGLMQAFSFGVYAGIPKTNREGTAYSCSRPNIWVAGTLVCAENRKTGLSAGKCYSFWEPEELSWVN